MAGGQRQPVNGKGWFVQATVLDGVDNRMTVAQEEIFGPVLAVIPFDDVGRRGRARPTTFPTASPPACGRATSRRRTRWRAGCSAGTVWVNMYNFYDPGMPFGGYKASGFGRDLGADSLRDYTQVKSVWMNLE